MLQISIDGKEVSVEQGATVIEAAQKLGTYIPHFCYHKKLSIAASCRMCLVEVEKAPKPLPACATPVTDGMVVRTHSKMARQAQEGVMEFLLINHPLDCPVCDKGGECQLQDLAVGYGKSTTRYTEAKRAVVAKEMGPLISTQEMSRCIHCSRCVRFTEEIAGNQEIGIANRGEHSEILTFIGRAVETELSGNVIDLCPVGALTSKPFRFNARSWELNRRKSVSAHDALGSNLIVQTKEHTVRRVLPLENEAINECWLSDRDRFAYEGLNHESRLKNPKIKQGGEWIDVDWQTALEYVRNGIECIAKDGNQEQIGFWANPMNTLEDAIRKIDQETRELLGHTFHTVNEHFGRMFPELFGGGQARLVMTGDEILDAGVQVMAQPPGKKNQTIHLLSGGEKALTAIALVFAIFQLNPAPFCLLDEVDAPLDDANTERYARLVTAMSGQGTQFLFISHNKIAMEMAEQLIGVTMQEQGVSRIVAVDMESAIRMAQ